MQKANWLFFITSIYISLIFSGCTSNKLAPGISGHVIRINGNGHPIYITSKKRLSDDQYKAHIHNILYDGIQRTLDTVPDGNKKKILIFIHGGLNSQSKSLKNSVLRKDSILKAGYYPIFINWSTGGPESYIEHLTHVREGVESRKIVRFLYPLTIVSDLISGYARLPYTFFNQSYNDLTTWPRYDTSKTRKSTFFPIRYNTIQLYKALDEKYKSPGGDTSQIRVSMGEDTRKKSIKMIKVIPYLVSLPINTFLCLPVVDGLGQPMWQNMKRRSQSLFRSSSEFDIRDFRYDNDLVKNALDASPSGALSIFMDSLCQFLNKDTTYEITLVGHSMGGIVSDQLLQNYKDKIKIKNIVYMAPANSINSFNVSVLPYLSKYPDSKFHLLCLHPVAENREANMFNLPFKGSLLTWVDNYYEMPASFMDRTLGRWENIMNCTQIIPHDLRGRISIRSFGVGPSDQYSYRCYRRLNPQKHSDFKKMKFWDERFW